MGKTQGRSETKREKRERKGRQDGKMQSGLPVRQTGWRDESARGRQHSSEMGREEMK
jgi:hypothetical protein